MSYTINQIFSGSYPPEAAIWCNKNNAHIEKQNNNYIIVANVIPAITKAEMTEYTFIEKCNIAYNGVKVIKNEIEYIFETSKDSITMCNSRIIALTDKSDDYTINWKVYKDNYPTVLTLTKQEFVNIFAFGMEMIDNTFLLEEKYNQEILLLTEEQLADREAMNTYKETIHNDFLTINTTITV